MQLTSWFTLVKSFIIRFIAQGFATTFISFAEVDPALCGLQISKQLQFTNENNITSRTLNLPSFPLAQMPLNFLLRDGNLFKLDCP